MNKIETEFFRKFVLPREIEKAERIYYFIAVSPKPLIRIGKIRFANSDNTYDLYIKKGRLPGIIEFYSGKNHKLEKLLLKGEIITREDFKNIMLELIDKESGKESEDEKEIKEIRLFNIISKIRKNKKERHLGMLLLNPEEYLYEVYITSFRNSKTSSI